MQTLPRLIQRPFQADLELHLLVVALTLRWCRSWSRPHRQCLYRAAQMAVTQFGTTVTSYVRTKVLHQLRVSAVRTRSAQVPYFGHAFWPNSTVAQVKRIDTQSRTRHATDATRLSPHTRKCGII